MYEENIISAVIHMEQTTHSVPLIFVPLTKRGIYRHEERRDGRQKENAPRTQRNLKRSTRKGASR